MFKKYLYYRKLIKEGHYKVLLKQIELNNIKPNRRFVKKLNLLYYQSSLLENWNSTEKDQVNNKFHTSLKKFIFYHYFPLLSVSVIGIICILFIVVTFCNLEKNNLNICKHLCFNCTDKIDSIIKIPVNPIDSDTIKVILPQPENKDTLRFRGTLNFATYITQIVDKKERVKIKSIENGQIRISPINYTNSKFIINIENKIFDSLFTHEDVKNADEFLFDLLQIGNYCIYPNKFNKSNKYEVKIIKKSNFFENKIKDIELSSKNKKEEELNSLLQNKLYYWPNQLFQLFRKFEILYISSIKNSKEDYISFIDNIYTISNRPEFKKFSINQKDEFFKSWWITLIKIFVNTELNNSKQWESNKHKLQYSLSNDSNFKECYEKFKIKLKTYYQDTFNLSKIDYKFNPPPD